MDDISCAERARIGVYGQPLKLFQQPATGIKEIFLCNYYLTSFFIGVWTSLFFRNWALEYIKVYDFFVFSVAVVIKHLLDFSTIEKYFLFIKNIVVII